MTKKIYLIDGNSFIYRMFFALPEFSTSTGRVVNATFGIAKFVTGQLVKENPDYIVFIKDAKGKNFRHHLYSDYKATREKMPDNLRSQIADIEHMIGAMGIDIVSVPGYEADDVIATLAKKLSLDTDNEIYILSGDKDLYALADEQVQIYDTQKKKISGISETREKFGVGPENVRDYLAICGDSSDNIPGIPGIGPKKAIVLLNHFGSLEEVYKAVASIDTAYDTYPDEVQKIFKGKTLEKIIEGEKSAFLSQKLATLCEDVEIESFNIEEYIFEGGKLYTDSLIDFFKELEFNSLLENITREKTTWKDIGKKVILIGDSQGLEELLHIIQQGDEVVLDTETSSLNPREANLIGVSILVPSSEQIYYINCFHRGPKVRREDLQKFFKKLFASSVCIIGHNLKYDLQVIEVFMKDNSNKNESHGDSSLGQTALEL